jgi:hypothetical protein
MRKTTSLLVGLFALCAHTALSQGTFGYQVGYWELTFHPTNNTGTQAAAAGQSQISLQMWGTEFNRNVTWTQEEITASLQVVDPFGNSWVFDPNGDSASGQTQANYSYSFVIAMTMQTPDGSLRAMSIDATQGHVQSLPPVPALGHAIIHEFGNGAISEETGYWTAEQFVPEPSSAALVMLGVVVWCLRRKVGGSGGNGASAVER